MPRYIYVNPITNEELVLEHSMSEVKNPSADLLAKITLEDGTVMKRKLVAPALLGFDNLGRSVKKEEPGTADKNGSTKAETKSVTKKESTPAKTEAKAATKASAA